jgi:hypothetical protein
MGDAFFSQRRKRARKIVDSLLRRYFRTLLTQGGKAREEFLGRVLERLRGSGPKRG